MKPVISILLLSCLLFSGCSDNKKGNNEPEGPEKFSQRYLPGQLFYSKTLGESIKYSVLLPEQYLKDESLHFGVVFLLHGMGGDENTWGPSGLNIKLIADMAESRGDVRPLIYIMPQGFNTYFCNNHDGSYKYMDMLVEELVPLVDKRFRTSSKSGERAIAGFSMGGFGALSIASQHKDVFSVAAGLSPSLNTDKQYATLSQDGWDSQWGRIFGGTGKYGNSRITSYYKSQCPLHFFADYPGSQFNGVSYYIDCGDDEERLYEGNGELHNLMKSRGINHEYRVRNGGHTDSYWRLSMAEVLPFIESSFSNQKYPDNPVFNIPEPGHSVARELDCGNTKVTVYLPEDYSADIRYKTLYFGKGDGNASLQFNDIALALDSLMTNKRLILACFKSKTAKAANTGLPEIINAVEKSYNVETGAENRLGLVYGSDGDFLYRYTLKGEYEIGFFFAEDSDCGNTEGTHEAELYYLNTGDYGTNNEKVHSMFCSLRNSKANVQYRVHNGTDSRTPVMFGIYNMSYFIGEQLKQK